MTEEDKKLLHTFEGKLRQLLFLYEELKKENLSLRNEIDRKSAEIAQLECNNCLLYTSPSPRDYAASRMPSSA